MKRAITAWMAAAVCVGAATASWAAEAAAGAVEKPIDPAVAAELADLAGKTALPEGTRIVFLGDSITAPGSLKYKYPEMIRDALAAAGLTAEVINAGRGGDNILSAGARLEADVLAHKPTQVFVNLGVNDSKLSAPDHTRNSVPLDRFTEGYRAVIEKLQASGAAVTLVGTIACVDEWTRKRAMGGEKKATYFGNPEQLTRYNAVVQALAKEFTLDYLDLYDLFRAQPDLTALFKGSDGVHAHTRGQELIARRILQALQKRFPKADGTK